MQKSADEGKVCGVIVEQVKTMKIGVVLSLVLGLCSVALPDARAFLGDDLATIEGHYGAALNRYQLAPGWEASVHESTGYRVLVLYRAGRSGRETFAKLGGPFDFTAPEINTFLRAHAAGQRWDYLGSHNGASLWTRPNALATYLADGEKTTLSFESVGDDLTAGVATAQTGTAPAAATDPSAVANPLTLGTLDLGHLELGQLQIGTLTLGQLQTGKLQTGKLQTGKLQIGSLNEPARPVQSP